MTTPPRDFTVVRVGTDTSGRPLYSTRFMWAVWQAVLRDPEIKPFAHIIVIVQGAFMARAGGGAAASAGYHDLGGCFDVRTWNLNAFQINALIRALRRAAMAAWRRDYSYLHGGMDPHIHLTAGWDRPLTGGALASWNGYLRNQNGLASGRVDYEWRPSPLVTFPPATLFAEEDYMTTSAAEKRLSDLQTQVQHLTDLAEAQATADQRRWAAERERDRAEKQRQRDRYRKLVAKIGGLVDDAEEGKVDVKKVLRLLAEEQDVTQEDNPAPEALEG